MSNSNDGSMPFLEHIREMRNRIIVSLIATFIFMIAAYIFHGYIRPFLINPLKQVEGIRLKVDKITEGFTIQIVVSLIIGFIVSLPIHLFNFIKFVFPGLTPKEKKIVSVTIVSSSILLIAGVYWGYDKIAPISISFLSNFVPKKHGVETILNYKGAILFVAQLLIAAVVLFQVPVVASLLMALQVVKRRIILLSMRYIIVVVFIISALITPPDIMSQCLIAFPLIILLFISVGIAKIFGWGE